MENGSCSAVELSLVWRGKSEAERWLFINVLTGLVLYVLGHIVLQDIFKQIRAFGEAVPGTNRALLYADSVSALCGFPFAFDALMLRDTKLQCSSNLWQLFGSWTQRMALTAYAGSQFLLLACCLDRIQAIAQPILYFQVDKARRLKLVIGGSYGAAALLCLLSIRLDFAPLPTLGANQTCVHCTGRLAPAAMYYQLTLLASSSFLTAFTLYLLRIVVARIRMYPAKTLQYRKGARRDSVSPTQLAWQRERSGALVVLAESLMGMGMVVVAISTTCLSSLGLLRFPTAQAISIVGAGTQLSATPLLIVLSSSSLRLHYADWGFHRWLRPRKQRWIVALALWYGLGAGCGSLVWAATLLL